MIVVTEQFYIEGTGDSRKDVEYLKAVDFNINGDGRLYVLDKEEKTIAYYPLGSYFKVVNK